MFYNLNKDKSDLILEIPANFIKNMIFEIKIISNSDDNN